jgi:hypothetical protein
MRKDEALSGEKIQDLLYRNEAFQIFRTVRSSPAYWSARKRDVFAMNRQIGPPTFFLTYSPGEIKWPELIRLLLQLNKQEGEDSYDDLSDEMILNLPKDRLYALVASDPVTTTRYLDNRMAQLRNFVYSPYGPFRDNKVEDYVWRLDFQERGSLHLHMCVWLEGAPKYDRLEREESMKLDELGIATSANRDSEEANDEAIIEFVDKYVTCHRPVENDDNVSCEGLFEDASDPRRDLYGRDVPISYQLHSHRFNCKVMEKSDDNTSAYRFCRYGFPKPIMERTCVLMPIRTGELVGEDLSKAKEMYVCFLM